MSLNDLIPLPEDMPLAFADLVFPNFNKEEAGTAPPA
jgi:hypothetical protein